MKSELIQLRPMASSRRDFLKATALATAAAGVAGCQVPERILPLVTPDPREIPGKAEFFSTVCRECPAGCGMMARVNSGRTSKAEGNPDHPVSRGKLCLRGQTAVQGLYNPDRFRQPLLRDAHGVLRPASWEEAMARWRQELATVQHEGRGGEMEWLGRLETGTLDLLIRHWMAAYQAPAPLYFEYFSYDVLRRAFAITHGRAVVPTYQIAQARYLVSFGAEFLETYISNVEYAGDFAAMHSYGHTPTPARTLAIGPRICLEAANTDEWWPARPGSEAALAQALLGLVAARLHRPAPAGAALDTAAELSQIEAAVIARAADRLLENRPSLVLGPGYGTDTRAALDCQIAVNRLNDLLGNTGVTVTPAAPHALSNCATRAQVFDLFDRAQAGQVRLLHLRHANPVYHHPQLDAALKKIPFIVSFASWMDETTQYADLILPDHHFLEIWGDYTPRPGVTGILQPTREPVFASRPTGDLLLATLPAAAAVGSFAGAPRFGEFLRTRWQGALGGEGEWHALLRRGVSTLAAPGAVPPSAAVASAVPLPQTPLTAPGEVAQAGAAFDGEGDYYLMVFPSVQFFDGRQANRTWAQEIAEPLTKIAWDPWVELHPDTAKKLGVEPNDVLRLHSPHGKAEFSVFIRSWVRPDTVAVLLGQGHTRFGMFADGAGDNVQKLQQPFADRDGVWHAQTVKVRLEKTGRNHPIANLQREQLQWDKKVAQATELQYAGNAASHNPRAPYSFYHYDQPYLTHRWGMAIDLSSCIGCNACQAACYAENNIAIFGRSSCRSHREMTWIRVELFQGSQAHPSTQLNPDLRFIPVPCQQCGNAPCEYVCPVFAAYHNDEGINAQVYNRCIGTRYCSNNCIYKVRRFNWYTPQWQSPLNQQLNPDVTVRAKGIMEKCTFCIQRIERVELDARTNHTVIGHNQIQVACQQTCPTQAIYFGDLLDPASEVVAQSKQDRAYYMFEKENCYPAVSYLKRVKFELNAPGPGPVPPAGTIE